MTFHHEKLKDNSYEARVCIFPHRLVGQAEMNEQMQSGVSANDYGARASRDLIVTKGVGFRKEKNKKKRGVSNVSRAEYRY